jgi:hypothetical protein
MNIYYLCKNIYKLLVLYKQYVYICIILTNKTV